MLVEGAGGDESLLTGLAGNQDIDLGEAVMVHMQEEGPGTVQLLSTLK